MGLSDLLRDTEMGVGPNYYRNKQRSWSSSGLDSSSPATFYAYGKVFQTKKEADEFTAAVDSLANVTKTPPKKPERLVATKKDTQRMNEGMQPLPNPQPDKYTILRSQQIGDWLVVEIHYDGCTNFEGKKTLLFKGITIEDLKKQQLIDPHFSDNSHYHHPIARFIPTPDGWRMAMSLAKSEQARKEGRK